MAYVTVGEFRILTNLTDLDLSDAEVEALISYSTAQVNRDIQTRIIRERIEEIDSTRDNKIDGTNTTYYAKNWKGHFFADSDDNGSVTISDVTVYQVDSDAVETTLTVSTIDEDDMNFDVSSAPTSGVTLYLSYHFANVSSTNSLLKLAVIYYTAALGYGKINLGRPTNFQIGEIRIISNLNSFKSYMDSYQSIVNKINDEMVGMVEANNVPF